MMASTNLNPVAIQDNAFSFVGVGRTEGGQATSIVRLSEMVTPGPTGSGPTVYSYTIDTALIAKIKSGLAGIYQRARLKRLYVSYNPIQGSNAIGTAALVVDYDALSAPTTIQTASRFTNKIIFPAREGGLISWMKQDPSDDQFALLDSTTTKPFNSVNPHTIYLVLEDCPNGTKAARLQFTMDLECKDLQQ